MPYSITRQEIIDAALSLRGTKFRHQGREAATGIDCVGYLVEVGKIIEYPEIFDVEGYRRTPAASVIRDMLRKNCREIPVEKAKPGDIYLMRMHGIKPRHTSIKISDDQIIHANFSGVQVNWIKDYPAAWYVAAFQVRGVKN